MLERLFPRRIDNAYGGHRAALWLLGLVLALKLLMSINAIANTESVASGADGFRLASYGADGANAVLMLFALSALSALMLTLVGIGALVRYRGIIPLVYLLLLVEHGARRLIVNTYAVERSATSVAVPINIALLVLLVLGFALSLSPAKQRST